MAGVYLRAARAEDQAAIRSIVLEARLYPLALHWSRFVVAESAREVVGVGQIKVLGDGAPELASLAVLPSYQGTGVGGALVWTLISRTPRPIYLRCASHNESFYHRFGFATLPQEEMPGSLRRLYRITNFFAGLYNHLTGGSERLVIMGRL